MSSGSVLITRPRAQAQSLAEELGRRGYTLLIEPLLEIVPLSAALPDLLAYQALVFTSANAVRVLAGMSEDRSHIVYTVGRQTQEAAREAGWRVVKSADGDAADLSAFLATESLQPDRPLLHVCGVDVVRPLIAPGLMIEAVPVYKAEAATALSDECLRRLDCGGIDTALFFSPRTATTFATLLEKHERTQAVSTIKALCLSDSVVKSLMNLPWQHVQAPQRPDTGDFLALLPPVATG